ncbi:MAG TPA: SPOR domain-containing protein [Ottowia sp.]|uniref:SPOR domain-containing protein n=1 Tax=Ottowia sp. TaxID=1898956 RepID=UPI002C81B219|nr:SPOR domain-containing protein [Ottowia sp.]HMN22527.1 SPOR domain-containing protein [Ottowia sp.]
MKRARPPSSRAAPRRGRRQFGGTFLGLVLGAIVGLAVALAVAIYVTRVPVPFLNKGATRSTLQDAAEAERNRDWDPNAALRGRGAANMPAPIGGAVAPLPDPALIPAPAVPPPAEVQPGAPALAQPRAPSPSADPLGDLAATRSGLPPPAVAPVDPFAYFVQAGAFRAAPEADAQRARLSLLGVEARVSEREQAGRTIYRVRVGPLQNRDAAERVRERLEQNGFDAALVRVQR